MTEILPKQINAINQAALEAQFGRVARIKQIGN